MVKWEEMTDQEVWNTLRSSPRIAGPWIRMAGGSWQRHDERGRALAWTSQLSDGTPAVFVPFDEFPRHTYTTWQSFPDCATVDATLRAHGWRLVESEQMPPDYQRVAVVQLDGDLTPRRKDGRE